jgi:hypothetical protein
MSKNVVALSLGIYTYKIQRVDVYCPVVRSNQKSTIEAIRIRMQRNPRSQQNATDEPDSIELRL